MDNAKAKQLLRIGMLADDYPGLLFFSVNNLKKNNIVPSDIPDSLRRKVPSVHQYDPITDPYSYQAFDLNQVEASADMSIHNAKRLKRFSERPLGKIELH